MRVSVIIPTLNEAAGIASAVERAWAAGADEVIVSDGGSADDTLARANSVNCSIVTSPRGRAPQLNAGAAVARGETFLFLHADNWLEAGAVEQARRAFRDTAVQIAAFRQRIDAEGALYRALERGNAARARLFGMAYGDQGICVRRELFDRIGGFPEVPLMEDVRFMRSARRFGRPALLPGPLHVSARRWQENGIARQTVRNWSLLLAERIGVPPQRLARFYPARKAD